MANQELAPVSTSVVDENQFNLVNSAGNEQQNRLQSAELKLDLPMLDYPVGGAFEAQNGMGHINFGSMVKMLIGWR